MVKIKPLFPVVNKFDINEMFKLYKEITEEEKRRPVTISFIIGPVKRGMFSSFAICTTSRKKFKKWTESFEEDDVDFASKEFDGKFFGCVKITSED